MKAAPIVMLVLLSGCASWGGSVKFDPTTGNPVEMPKTSYERKISQETQASVTEKVAERDKARYAAMSCPEDKSFEQVAKLSATGQAEYFRQLGQCRLMLMMAFSNEVAFSEIRAAGGNPSDYTGIAVADAKARMVRQQERQQTVRKGLGVAGLVLSILGIERAISAASSAGGVNIGGDVSVSQSASQAGTVGGASGAVGPGEGLEAGSGSASVGYEEAARSNQVIIGSHNFSPTKGWNQNPLGANTDYNQDGGLIQDNDSLGPFGL